MVLKITQSAEYLIFSNISNNLNSMTTFTPDQREVLTSAHIIEALDEQAVPEAPRLITGSEAIELPVQLAKVFKVIAQDFAQGKAVTVIAHETKMTTQSAADFLSVSRPTLIKLLGEFNIPFETIGRHRRIDFGHVTELNRRLKEKRSQAVQQMLNSDQTSGMLEVTTDRNPLIRKK